MKSPCCNALLDSVDCDCDDENGRHVDCDFCYGDGFVHDYLECSECGEQHHVSDIEDHNSETAKEASK